MVDGVRRSLATGFVYTSHDLSEDLLDSAYGLLRQFFTSRWRRSNRSSRRVADRPDRLHRSARRDRGVQRCARLERDAQLGPPSPGGPSAAQLALPPLRRAGAAGGRPCPASPRCSDAVPRRDRRPTGAVPTSHRRSDRLPRVVLRRDDHRRGDAHTGDPLPGDGRGARPRPTSGPVPTATST